MPDGHGPSPFGDTHALIVSSSQYFHNYRHVANALLMADGVSAPERTVLMLAGATPCDPRNAAAGSIYAATDAVVRKDLYPPQLRVDYHGAEVTVESFLGVLTDRMPGGLGTAATKRLRSTASSRLLLYLTGHGGNEFLKFSDQFELTSAELAVGIQHAFALGRCREVLLLVDTCQAASLAVPLPLLPSLAGELDGGGVDGPPPQHRASDGMAAASMRRPLRVASLSSSAVGESSYSYDTDRKLGVATSDRFTFHVAHFLARAAPPRDRIAHLDAYLQRAGLMSTAVRLDVGWGLEHPTTEGAQQQASGGGSGPTTRDGGIRDGSMAAPATPGPSEVVGARPLKDFFETPRRPASLRGLDRHPPSPPPHGPTRMPAARWRELEARALSGGLDAFMEAPWEGAQPSMGDSASWHGSDPTRGPGMGPGRLPWVAAGLLALLLAGVMRITKRKTPGGAGGSSMGPSRRNKSPRECAKFQ